ncbi:MAG TPA: hypothetical protein VKE42_09260, partial [Candidatus Cybelea sp.]|nr:hypothetical protein [Candidatus Cybelea sp.]
MEIATVECPHCHAETFEGAHFCIRCGKRLDDPVVVAPKLSSTLAMGAPVAAANSPAPSVVAAAVAAPPVAAPPVTAAGDIASSLRQIDADFGALAPQAAPAGSVPAPSPSVAARDDES